jgi:hypothetical protein
MVRGDLPIIYGTTSGNEVKPVRVDSNGLLITAESGTGTTVTPGLIRPTTSGTIAAGKNSASFYNAGAVSGTLLGVTLAVGETVSFSAPGGYVLDAIAYDATGTTFLIGTL